jgi:hypothetical protein
LQSDPNFDLMRSRLSSFLAAVALASPLPAVGQQPRLEVPLVTDEAEAVLAILESRARGARPDDAAWHRLFSSEGYSRLQRRERSLGRTFEDSTFRAFVLSDTLARRTAALRATLESWKRLDPSDAARRAFAYLPQRATIRARIYPVIKPLTNSFVFEPRINPAIFLYVDPAEPTAKFDNTLVHELHHIGTGSVCSGEPTDSTRGVRINTALAWMSGFAEGRAVLAAAGAPNVHPHTVSDSAERAVWERDVARVERDMRTMETFFLRILNGAISQREQQQIGMSFVATDTVPQGPFYTIGWLMSATVERQLGRARLVASTCDPLRFLRDYNRAAAAENRSRKPPLPLWSEELLRRLTPAPNRSR